MGLFVTALMNVHDLQSCQDYQGPLKTESSGSIGNTFWFRAGMAFEVNLLLHIVPVIIITYCLQQKVFTFLHFHLASIPGKGFQGFSLGALHTSQALVSDRDVIVTADVEGDVIAAAAARVMLCHLVHL